MLDAPRLGVTTITNYLRIIYSIDWPHAHGLVEDVIIALRVLDWDQITCVEDVPICGMISL
jgi:hypothetical protein